MIGNLKYEGSEIAGQPCVESDGVNDSCVRRGGLGILAVTSSIDPHIGNVSLNYIRNCHAHHMPPDWLGRERFYK